MSNEPDQSVPVCVQYNLYWMPLAAGELMKKGYAFTSYDVDWTVKIEVTGLQPDTSYWYQFNDCADTERKSPMGSTRTIASLDSMSHFFFTFSFYINSINSSSGEGQRRESFDVCCVFLFTFLRWYKVSIFFVFSTLLNIISNRMV